MNSPAASLNLVLLPEAAAIRELAEETGFKTGQNGSILVELNFNAYANEWRHLIILQQIVSQSGYGQSLEPNEIGGELLKIDIKQTGRKCQKRQN